MITVGRIDDVRTNLERARAGGDRVGFVPTMGALHEGHLSLVRRARSECGFVCLSIFVNPGQFGPGEDLGTYPRTLGSDLAACEREGVDLVFHPTADQMYPQPPLTRVVVGGLSEAMEGRFRPGHLEGVALVCAKLFAIVGPCRAYFGEKDAQQLRVVRRMAADLDLPAEIVGCPTVRDPDGLALSSRNAYLGAEERTPALALSRVLFDVQDRVRRGESDPRAQIERARASLREAGVDAVDYVEIVHPETLEAVGTIDGPVLVCAAVRVGATRLIDNVMAAPAEAAAEVREELRT